jgi:hypothetical protein
VLRVRSAVNLAVKLLLATLLFGCAHRPGENPSGTPAAFDAAPGSPTALLLAEDCPLSRALEEALTQGGVRVQTLATPDAAQIARALDPSVADAHRFVLGVGEAMAAAALQAARQRPLAGLVLVDPPPLHFGTESPPPAPTLLLLGAQTPPIAPTAGAAVWDLRFPGLDGGWCDLPSGDLHALTEATVLWIRSRSSD